ncbi:F0F1 ATP synthase subunit delta [Mucilaginibacter limnophilus]|uniref:ATP synthase subunit delta n=1 Tax=Mucilaginibacter limnophilus TaxID=1932778 RepID=A0A437MVA5_9SPHI|nr:ATP synthase F1 subunit delta [Mucilaginibacter limnophilus]RVU01589.1 F0F1 ATP synthase subunit delta [Mucilaginibacter limnophilus]
MSELTVASRYAKSLIDLAIEQNSVEAVKADMVVFLKILRENPQLKAVLSNPIISQTKKTAIVKDVFGSSVSKVTLAFLNIMISKGRGEVIYATANELINQYNAKENIIKATVVTATPLNAENKQKFSAEVQAATGSSQVILETRVDPDLIGGFVLTVGDRQIDTSIASDLKKLKKEFAKKVVQ